MSEQATREQHSFNAEVGRLLEIVTHSLYSNRDIFLRELIANAADACERRRFAAIAEPALLPEDGFAIEISVDKDAGTLTIADRGIGMTREELTANLGTIAASGTGRFLEQLKEKGKDPDKASLSQIGQFGVGFYSAFMVADLVTVDSRYAGSAEGWRWQSSGAEGYTLDPTENAPAGGGTAVVLSLKEDAKEYLDGFRLKQLVKTHCEHIGVEIRIPDEEGKSEAVNQASPLWRRPASDVTEEQYAAFYRDASRAFDEPWQTLHWKAEGAIEYTGLLFVPRERPPSIFHPDRQSQIRLYVKQVFITDDCQALVPPYLRFLQGVIDCEDLPLNVSRELLQSSPVLTKIRQGLVKRVLRELGKAADKDVEGYKGFWEAFGPILKEGLYEDASQRDQLLALTRFRSSTQEGLTSLKDYLGRMKEGQEAIYTLSGTELDRLASSPHLEGFRARDIEVLYLTDPVDEFWTTMVTDYEGKPFRSVTRGQADLDRFDGKEEDSAESETQEEGQGPLLAAIRLALGDKVKEVRVSKRLAESPACLVAGEGDMDLNLERLLRSQGQVAEASPRILEVNAKHPLLQAMSKQIASGTQGGSIDDSAWLLFELARVMEGEQVSDPASFSQRLTRIMGQAVGSA
ncbi:MAG: molecular chaperone HtpG [Kiloniellales bacterium]